MTATVFLGLGANLGDPRDALERAQVALGEAGVRVIRRARLYRSAPVGPPDQPRYWNTACEVRTEQSPEALLDTLKTIERDLGRTPTVRWGPRIIDLDIVLYGDDRVDTERLTIPHREMHRRRFVLAPLADLAPERVVPGHDRTVAALLEALGPPAPDELEIAEDEVRTC